MSALDMTDVIDLVQAARSSAYQAEASATALEKIATTLDVIRDILNQTALNVDTQWDRDFRACVAALAANSVEENAGLCATAAELADAMAAERDRRSTR